MVKATYAEAAILAVLDILQLKLSDLFSQDNQDLYQKIERGLTTFVGLPHRIQFIRELNQVRYYDDNYSSAFPATDVAIKSFDDYPTVLIAGGKDRHLDLTAMKKRLFSAKNLILNNSFCLEVSLTTKSQFDSLADCRTDG